MTQIGWLIYNREDAYKNQGYIDWMLEEAHLTGMKLDLYYYEDFLIGHHESRLTIFYNGKIVEAPAFAIVRTIDSFFTKQLELMGTICFNSSFVSEVCNDKAKTHQYLTSYGIPMADTVYVNHLPLATDIPFPFPVIVKAVHGRGGKNVYLLEKETDLTTIPVSTGKWIIQKPGVFGKDIRVFVIGKRIVAAVLRESATDFKANYTLGGSASLYSLSLTERELVERVMVAFDFGMVGIDFIFSPDGRLLLNEIEDVVGSRTLSALSDINIVREYLSYIDETIKKD